MTNEEYLMTLEIKGTSVDIGLDDYGQCYFFEYINKDGEKISRGCGTYNTEFLEEVYYEFDPKGVMISLDGEEEYEEGTQRLLERYEKMKTSDPQFAENWYNQIIKPRFTQDYEIYDFEKMYKELEI